MSGPESAIAASALLGRPQGGEGVGAQRVPGGVEARAAPELPGGILVEAYRLLRG